MVTTDLKVAVAKKKKSEWSSLQRKSQGKSEIMVEKSAGLESIQATSGGDQQAQFKPPSASACVMC